MTNPNETKKKYPTHTAYVVDKKDGEDKPIWISVGAAWENNDGEGFNLILEILGQKIPLTIRKNKPKPE